MLLNTGTPHLGMKLHQLHTGGPALGRPRWPQTLDAQPAYKRRQRQSGVGSFEGRARAAAHKTLCRLWPQLACQAAAGRQAGPMVPRCCASTCPLRRRIVSTRTPTDHNAPARKRHWQQMQWLQHGQPPCRPWPSTLPLRSQLGGAAWLHGAHRGMPRSVVVPFPARHLQ